MLPIVGSQYSVKKKKATGPLRCNSPGPDGARRLVGSMRPAARPLCEEKPLVSGWFRNVWRGALSGNVCRTFLQRGERRVWAVEAAGCFPKREFMYSTHSWAQMVEQTLVIILSVERGDVHIDVLPETSGKKRTV